MRDQRIHFSKNKQRDFLNNCIYNLNCISLRGLLQYGIKTNYSNLKNYYTERRLLPKTLFEDLTYLSKINPKSLKTKTINPNWGQTIGGKLSKR